MLTASDLSAMRSTITSSLPDTAILGTLAYVSDGGGGGTSTFVASGTIDFRIAPVASSGAGEKVEGGRIHPDTEYIGTAPYGTTVDDDMRFVISSRTYTVTAIRAPRSWELSRRIELKEIV